MEHSKILGTERIGRLLVLFSVPSVISLVLNALYNMVDQIFIGQGVGYLANGATNVIFPMTQLAIALSLLLGDGTASYMNLKLGEGQRREAARGMAAGIVGLIWVGAALLALYSLLLEPLCLLFGATQATLPYALDYGRIISLGIPFCVIASGTMSMVRADGSPKVAMLGMVVGCAINLIGDPVAIFVLGMGVKGAAWATILGQLANMLVNAVYLARHSGVKLDRELFRGSLPGVPRVARLGLSSFATQLSVALVILIENNLLVYYGAQSQYGSEIPMTALGVTMKVFTVLQCAIVGLVSGAQPILSYNFGGRQLGRVRETLKYLLAISLALMTVATVWFQLAPMSIIQIFGSSNELYNQFAVKCLRLYLMFLVLDGLQMVVSSFLQSIGKPLQAALLVLLRQLVVLIPCMVVFARLFGVEGTLYAGPVAGLVVGAASFLLLVREWRALRRADGEPLPQSSPAAS